MSSVNVIGKHQVRIEYHEVTQIGFCNVDPLHVTHMGQHVYMQRSLGVW